VLLNVFFLKNEKATVLLNVAGLVYVCGKKSGPFLYRALGDGTHGHASKLALKTCRLKSVRAFNVWCCHNIEQHMLLELLCLLNYS
jgi:hypothetical protein